MASSKLKEPPSRLESKTMIANILQTSDLLKLKSTKLNRIIGGRRRKTESNDSDWSAIEYSATVFRGRSVDSKDDTVYRVSIVS